MKINKALLEIVLDSRVLDAETRTCIQVLLCYLGLASLNSEFQMKIKI